MLFCIYGSKLSTKQNKVYIRFDLLLLNYRIFKHLLLAIEVFLVFSLIFARLNQS